MESTVEKFYEAFNNLDPEGMISCYHPNIEFEDPAFGKLKGQQVGNMWRMLCESQKGQDFKVTHSNVKANGNTGSAHWEAFYTFSRTGKRVHNIIEASFIFEDGKIIKHTDTFNLYRWSKQALGFSGYTLGWTKMFKKKLNAQANAGLQKYIQNRN